MAFCGRHGWALLIRPLMRCVLVAVLLQISGWIHTSSLRWGLLLAPVIQTFTAAVALSGSRRACCWARHSQSLYQIALLFLLFSTLGQWLRHFHSAPATGLFPLLLGVWCASSDDGTETQVSTSGAKRLPDHAARSLYVRLAAPGQLRAAYAYPLSAPIAGPQRRSSLPGSASGCRSFCHQPVSREPLGIPGSLARLALPFRPLPPSTPQPTSRCPTEPPHPPALGTRFLAQCLGSTRAPNC
jgi:hypothetical protein